MQDSLALPTFAAKFEYPVTYQVSIPREATKSHTLVFGAVIAVTRDATCETSRN